MKAKRDWDLPTCRKEWNAHKADPTIERDNSGPDKKDPLVMRIPMGRYELHDTTHAEQAEVTAGGK
eukprot:13864651-Alexandrium_andersonii.AAC.1